MVKSKFYNLDTDTTLSENSDLYIPSQKATKTYVDTIANTKQDTLVSGTNIKTINNESILGSGNIDIQGGGSVDYDDKSITKNSSDELQATGVINSNNDTKVVKLWTGTQAQYDPLLTLDWSVATEVSNLAYGSWRGLVYNGTKYIAVGGDGNISTSTDGTTWEEIRYDSNLPEYIKTIGYNGTTYVVLGGYGYISTSSDGENWTITDVENLNVDDFYSLAWDGSKFVALGNNGYISTSTNGSTWTEATQISNLNGYSWCSMAYDGTKFVAIGDSNSDSYSYISTSTDGITWTTPVHNKNFDVYNTFGYIDTQYWNTLIYDGNKFVALSDKAYISFSTDGLSWSKATKINNLSDQASYYWGCLCYNGTGYVALNSDGYISICNNVDNVVDDNTLYALDDGIYRGGNKIGDVSNNGKLIIYQNGANKGEFTANTSENITIKLDGYDGKSIKKYTSGTSDYIKTIGVIDSKDDTTAIKTWTGTKLEYDNYLTNTVYWNPATEDSNLSSKTWYVMVYGNNKFVAICSNNYISTSIDGTTWTAATQVSNLGNKTWYGLSWNGAKFISLSSSGYISISTDGTTWTAATQISNLGSKTWRDLIWDGTKFVAISQAGYISTSTDGENWTAATQVSNLGDNNWRSIAWNGTKFVALSYTGYISTSTDGENWTVAKRVSNLPEYGYWNRIIWDTNRFVALGNTGYISTSINGTTWHGGIGNTNLGGRNWYGLAFNGTKLFALSYRGYVSTSEEADPTMLYNVVEDGLYLGPNKVASYSSGGGSSYTAGTGIDITNNAISVTSPTIVSNTDQDITGTKTFIGEKKIHFKQSAATDKLGFTLFDNSDGELAAFEYRPNTIGGNALMNINTSQSGTNWLGFRYWANINIVAPKPSNGTYYIPVNITNGTTTVTANNAGIVNVSTLIPTIATSVSSSSTNSQTVGAKLFYDTCGDIETLINAL